ncbi:MAG: hypothetical protein ACLT42_04720 [Acidaminococcus intestini]
MTFRTIKKSVVKRSVACKKYSEGKITRQTSVMPIPDTPVQKSVMGSAINKPSKAVIFELDSMMITPLGSSPYARGILATLIILARNSFEYNVIGFWVIIHISVYLASTFLVFLNRRKNTVFALLAIFGVVAPYFAIITAEILFLHRRPPLFLAISNFKVNVYLA